MISLLQACEIASDFYRANLKIEGLAGASETDQAYIFDCGKKNTFSVGGMTICVNKESGQVSVLEFPSAESTALIQSAQKLEVPERYVLE